MVYGKAFIRNYQFINDKLFTLTPEHVHRFLYLKVYGKEESDNVLEERQAPDQIIIGANDTSFCTLLVLAIYLDSGIKSGRISRGRTLFGISKQVASSHLIGELPVFENLPLNTHSIRKFPSTYTRMNGCSRDDVDARGG